MRSAEREFLLSLAELLDRLAIYQIKQFSNPKDGHRFEIEIKKIESDLELIFTEIALKLDARFIHLVVVLAQINLHIWHVKEVMQTDPSQFEEAMKLAHQLNGIRNQIKNAIMEKAGVYPQSQKKTNTDTDNLRGWVISVLSS